MFITLFTPATTDIGFSKLMKKFTVLSIITALLFCFCSCTDTKTEAPVSTVYATVNGANIMTDEIDYFKSRSKADIINEYAEKYGVTDFADFWDKEFDGKTPTQALEELALEQAVEAKIKLVMMRENGIYDDVSFSALKSKAESYNAEHQGATKSVGITSIDLDSFYTYYVSTGEMELKNTLAENELKPDDSELDAVRNEHSDLTDEGLISLVVSEKYEKLIEQAIKDAEIIKK